MSAGHAPGTRKVQTEALGMHVRQVDFKKETGWKF